jgi:hypothetical protein
VQSPQAAILRAAQETTAQNLASQKAKLHHPASAGGDAGLAHPLFEYLKPAGRRNNLAQKSQRQEGAAPGFAALQRRIWAASVFDLAENP